VTRQNLREREIAMALNELTGKITIRQARDHLKQRGFLPFDDDSRDQWELERARKLLQRARKYDNGSETGKIEFISLFETLEDGRKSEYYRKAEECTIDEAVQHLEYWNKYRRVADNRLRYYYRIFSKTHGRRKIQRRLSFAMPTPVA
jgi:hypothetical protein